MRDRIIGALTAFLASVVVAALLPLLTGAAQPDRGPRVHTVRIQAIHFVPARLVIAPGDEVQWSNEDIFLHAMKATSGAAWQSVDLPPHATWSRRFTDGCRYVCPYHPTMTGEIVVERGTKD